MRSKKKIDKMAQKIDHWEYIAVHTKNGWGIYEGYFDKHGRMLGRTERTIRLEYFDSKDEIQETLLSILRDIE